MADMQSEAAELQETRCNRSKLRQVAIDDTELSTLLSDAVRERAIEYAREKNTTLLFTEDGTWYMPMPDRHTHPEYMDYLRDSKNFTGTAVIAARDGHAYPSLKSRISNSFTPIHLDVRNSFDYSQLINERKAVPALYKTEDDSFDSPLESALIIGLNERQQSVLETDHMLAEYTVDVPPFIKYSAGNDPEVTNCAKFTIGFLNNVGIKGLPHTNSANVLRDSFKKLASGTATERGQVVEYSLNLETLFDINPNWIHSGLEPYLDPKLKIRQVGLCGDNPAVAVDASEVAYSIEKLYENDIYFHTLSVNKLVDVLHGLGVFTGLEKLENHRVSGDIKVAGSWDNVSRDAEQRGR